ncbi:hypothetical protein VBD025_02115 [Virgibacillus flavescens]
MSLMLVINSGLYSNVMRSQEVKKDCLTIMKGFQFLSVEYITE